MSKKFQNVLITGGAGYVGTVLADLLLKSGYRVRVLDSLLVGGQGLLSFFPNKNFEFIKGDIRDDSAVRTALRGMDAVIHLAAIIGYPACKKEPVLSRDVNVTGTQRLIEAGEGRLPILFASTGTVYGEVKDVICTEDTPLHPISEYSVQKAEGETIVRSSAGGFIIYRFATGFGVSPRMRIDNVPNAFTYRAVHEGYLVVYEKNAKRTFIHVRDMARAFQFGLENFDSMKNAIYNVGDNNLELTKEELCNLIKEKVDYYLHYAEVGSDVDKRDYPVSYDKIVSTGFRATVSMREGIDELVRAVRALS